MGSFQISLTPTRRAATRFISQVRRSLLAALIEGKEKSGLTQSDVANSIGVHRSVINRELRGMKDITLGRVAELAFSMGKEIEFKLIDPEVEIGRNIPKLGVISPRTADMNRVTTATHSQLIKVDIKSSRLVAA
jgi:transcriptional regulator with XRE-family HTH domain